ncbi:DUF5673 domain-containing protein [Desulfosporosinus nitroreducens]|uniref:DUF5673 domain-containing protein n=1 Tax=Desulfosporosinus nitroreducens TaxID=2018668 RepID=UPI00207D2D79|nr:DUF5673 domain-containing protein [Desulfosporosinus nitroreducens]MCO1604748.1 DUF5673 domain-containing protein [Desulfosporosinus nitroreducens]
MGLFKRGDGLYIAIYFFAVMFVMGLQVYGVIPQNFAIAISITIGIIILILDVYRIEVFKRYTGKILIQLESDLKTSKVALPLDILIVALIITYVYFSLTKIPKLWLLEHPVNLVILYRLIYELYIDFFSKRFFMDKGLFIGGKLIKWNKMESYDWPEKQVFLLKGYSRLLIKRKTKIMIGEELNLKINTSQITEIDNLLRKNISNSEIVG